MTNVVIEAKCNFCKETIKFEENDPLFFICLVMMILKGFFTNVKIVVGKMTLNCPLNCH